MRKTLDKAKNARYNMSETHDMRGGHKMNGFQQMLKEHNITQDGLAKALGVHQTLISQWCHGKCKPNVYQIKGISRHVGVSVETVVGCFGFE